MKLPIIPEWCKGLPDKTILFSCDIVEFFDCKNVTRGVANKIIPEPIQMKLTKFKLKGIKGATKYYWLLGDIRKLRTKMLSEQKEMNQ